jgi:hypothetical protein
MTRTELVLAILAAAEGRPYTPVQIQKAVFLVSRNMPALVDSGRGFAFVPYDYGPFDSDVYQEAQLLKSVGDALVTPAENQSRWNTYSASENGVARGTAILDALPPGQAEYIRSVSKWVRSLNFGALVKSIYAAYPDMKANSIFKGAF